MSEKIVEIPKLDIRADIVANSFDERANTIEVVASVGSRVLRQPFFSEAFVEELEISRDAVRLERFNQGAPVLKDHNAASVDGQIGVVEGARIEGGELRAVVKFRLARSFSLS